MNDALIGHTGFVGGSLLGQHKFDDCYNSKNIESIAGRKFNLLVCSGAPAEKWRANQDPASDLANLQRLMQNLSRCRANRVILISTIDVYSEPVGVDERSVITPANHHAYGRNRYLLEQFITDTFRATHILRLPGLYGPGLKKNLIFDLIRSGQSQFTHCQSTFQFYDTTRLWSDCATVIREELPLVNLAVQPVGVAELAQKCFGISFDNVTSSPPATYDMHTRYAEVFGKPNSLYLADQDECFAGIARFARQSRAVA